jgi:hypothetical protein
MRADRVLRRLSCAARNLLVPVLVPARAPLVWDLAGALLRGTPKA